MPGFTHMPEEQRLKSVLVATDLSPASNKPIFNAISIARCYGARLNFTYVVSSIGYKICGAGTQALANEVSRRDMATFKARDGHKASAMQQLTNLISTDALNCEPQFVVEFADPANGIMRAATTLRAEAVIMGPHYHASVEAVTHLPWSTTHKVLREAACPVLTIRG